MSKTFHITERYPITDMVKDNASFIDRCKKESLLRNESTGFVGAIAEIVKDESGHYVQVDLVGVH